MLFRKILSAEALTFSFGPRSWARDLARGREFRRQKRFDDADVALRRGLSKSAREPPLLVEYALSAQDGGRHLQALERWEQARAIMPDLPIVWFGSVVNACHLGMRDWAEPVAVEAARRFPADESIAREAQRLTSRAKITACVSCTSHYVEGWVSQEPISRQIILAILVNGREQGRVAPWLDGSDVERAIGTQSYRFFFEFPERLRSGDVVSIGDYRGVPVNGYGHAANAEGFCAITYTVDPLGTSTDILRNRVSIANHFFRGNGAEIGAFTMPTDLSPDLNVAYYDRFPLAVLRTYNSLPHLPIMKPSILGEAETLDGLGDASLDFLIANHVIEHLRDPIRFLENIARALRAGGRALIAAPDKRFTFDIRRPLTPFEHLVQDHEVGPQGSERDHLFEFATLVDGRSKEAALAWIDQRNENQMPIHYHVWDAGTFVRFVNSAIERFKIPLRLIYSDDRTKEIDVVLEKLG